MLKTRRVGVNKCEFSQKGAVSVVSFLKCCQSFYGVRFFE